ncbi:hypothetical protein L6452_02086 [Arctium lappa]|uniref:Uncharacterized protein n=1 Tax=Arctium lappa TaxID=4217 RepID=A0ACB9FJ39_ARCLA|nr:hypothetical protein L6452_02086 [Arctium lappa]
MYKNIIVPILKSNNKEKKQRRCQSRVGLPPVIRPSSPTQRPVVNKHLHFLPTSILSSISPNFDYSSPRLSL